MLKHFYSMKTALILMALIIIIAIIGTFQPDSAVYHSYLFQGLLFLLIINTLLCTGKRIPQLLSKARVPNPPFDKIKQEFHKCNEFNIQAFDRFKENLNVFYHQHRYHVIHLRDDQAELIFARKGIISIIANQVIHWALIIVFTGALIGSFGWTTEVSSEVGQITDLSNTHLKIRIDDFTTLYNKDRSVENWVTRLTLLADEKELVKGATRVNHPFQYQGVTFYQSGYGYQCNFELNQNGMTKKYQIPLNQIMGNGNKAFMLEKKGVSHYALKVYENSRENKTYQLSQGTVVNLPNQTSLKLLGESAFTVLKVKTDPGTGVVMIGLILGALGFMLLYSVQYREIKFLIDYSNQIVRFSVHCKNNLLREQLTNEIINVIGNLKA